MASLFAASTIEPEHFGLTERPDSFFFHADETEEEPQAESSGPSSLVLISRQSNGLYVERVLEPHPSIFRKSKQSKRVFTSRRDSASAAAAIASQWRAENTPPASRTTSRTARISPTRASTSSTASSTMSTKSSSSFLQKLSSLMNKRTRIL